MLHLYIDINNTKLSKLQKNISIPKIHNTERFNFKVPNFNFRIYLLYRASFKNPIFLSLSEKSQ